MESAKVYPLKRNRLERSVAVTAPATPPKPKLLDQVRQAIRTRHYSPRTEETYVHWIKRFIFFHNKRHPAEMTEAEIARFLSNLAAESHVSASTQNQALMLYCFSTGTFCAKTLVTSTAWFVPTGRRGYRQF